MYRFLQFLETMSSDLPHSHCKTRIFVRYKIICYHVDNRLKYLEMKVEIKKSWSQLPLSVLVLYSESSRIFLNEIAFLLFYLRLVELARD